MTVWGLRSSVRSFVRPFVRSFVRSRLWYFLSPLDDASVREAQGEQASTAVREAHCAQATVARLVTFESLKWKYSFATNSALFMKLGSLLYVRCRTVRRRAPRSRFLFSPILCSHGYSQYNMT